MKRSVTVSAAIKFANNSITGGLVENGEIFGGTATNAVSGSYFTARRLHIYNMQSDCFRVKNQATIEYCYMHDFGLSPNSHGDGVQMYPTDGSGHIIRFNHIDARNANAALFQVDNGWHIEGNYLRGGNYTIYCEGIPENKFINNTWAKDYKYGPLYIGRGEKSALTWSGNKWDNGTAFNVT